MPPSPAAQASLERGSTGATPLLSTVLDLLAGLGVLRQRKMFGGVYIYCDDLFIATVHDNTLYFKANASTAPAFIDRKLKQFSYPKEGGIATLQYYEAPPEVFAGRGAMKTWAKKALMAAKQDAASKRATSPSGMQANRRARAKKASGERSDA